MCRHILDSSPRRSTVLFIGSIMQNRIFEEWRLLQYVIALQSRRGRRTQSLAARDPHTFYEIIAWPACLCCKYEWHAQTSLWQLWQKGNLLLLPYLPSKVPHHSVFKTPISSSCSSGASNGQTLFSFWTNFIHMSCQVSAPKHARKRNHVQLSFDQAGFMNRSNKKLYFERISVSWDFGSVKYLCFILSTLQLTLKLIDVWLKEGRNQGRRSADANQEFLAYSAHAGRPRPPGRGHFPLRSLIPLTSP